MNNYQLSQTEFTRSPEIDPLAIFFFFLGALHIYSSLKRRAREREDNRYSFSISKAITLTSYGGVALLTLIVALSH